jgi:hypothetical protein
MRGLLRVLAAASVVGALAVLLRELFRDRPELLKPKRNEEPRAASNRSPGTIRNGAVTSRAELYEEARRLEIQGRSKMNKRQLERAVDEARGATR